ncbi:Mediator-associated protein 3 [Linum grandiflorum]
MAAPKLSEEEISAGTEKKIVKRVRKILEKENLYQLSERQVREEASEKLGIDLSEEPYKSVVRREVEDFLLKVMSQGIHPGIQSRLK